MKKYKVKINYRSCIGCGVCSSYAPSKIKMNISTGLIDISDFKKEGDFLIGEVLEDILEEVEAAARACPQMIIKIQK